MSVGCNSDDKAMVNIFLQYVCSLDILVLHHLTATCRGHIKDVHLFDM